MLIKMPQWQIINKNLVSRIQQKLFILKYQFSICERPSVLRLNGFRRHILKQQFIYIKLMKLSLTKNNNNNLKNPIELRVEEKC